MESPSARNGVSILLNCGIWTLRSSISLLLFLLPLVPLKNQRSSIPRLSRRKCNALFEKKRPKSITPPLYYYANTTKKILFDIIFLLFFISYHSKLYLWRGSGGRMPVAFVSLEFLWLRRLRLLLLRSENQTHLTQIRHHITQHQWVVILQMNLRTRAQIGALRE